MSGVEGLIKELRLAACGLFTLSNDKGDYGYFDDLADRLAALSAIEGGGGATPPATPIAGDVLWLDRWADLERLAKAATDGPWSVDERLEPECVRGRYDDIIVMETERLSDAAFIAAANPAAILELIAAARQQPNREG